MWFRLLGAAAGGGFPQWNCACEQCRAVRADPERAEARSHASLALSEDLRHWHVVNATPDLRSQIELAGCLHPGPEVRATPISSVLLTDAELDHAAGLLTLREASRMDVRSTASVALALGTAFPVASILAPYLELRWRCVEPDTPFRLGENLWATAFLLGPKKPRYAAEVNGDEAWVVGYRFEDRRTGAAITYAPVVATWTQGLERACRDADWIFVDGTFWSDDELAAAGAGTKTARGMGHLPVGGAGGILDRLRTAPHARRVLVHINNTNPILHPDSPERDLVRRAGVEIGRDGLEGEA